jgi:hypothetical protein
MKKLIFCLMATCLSLTFFQLQATAQTTTRTSNSTLTPIEPVKQVEATTLKQEIIVKLDSEKPNLKSKDKKNLQRSDRRSDRQNNPGGVYISVGGVIIILLLILIFA